MNILCCIKMPADYLQKARLKAPIPSHKELQTLYYTYLMISPMMK